MPKGFATIWDGVNFKQVPVEEAEKLEKEDKCQNLSRKFVSATEMKTRKEFTGYKTREVRASAPSEPAPVPTPPKADKPAKAKVKVNSKLWKNYRKAAADALGQPFNKTTKADTIAYMEKQVELAET